jgi:hypothetical protein
MADQLGGRGARSVEMAEVETRSGDRSPADHLTTIPARERRR